MAKFGNPLGGVLWITQTEIWKPVKGYEGLYEVSNKGSVKSLARNKKIGGGAVQPIKEHLLTNSKNAKGYHRVNLWKDNKYKTYTVHRLVLGTFSKNTGEKRTINHKNGVKIDNRLENLEWATDKENIRHAINTGLMDYKGEGNPMSKLSAKDVRRIKLGIKSGIAPKELASIYNINSSLISMIKSGRRWTHIQLNLVD